MTTVAVVMALTAAVASALIVWVCFRLMKTLDRMLTVQTAERERHRIELEGLFNRIQHPRVYQPTAEQEKTIREAQAPRADDFEKAGRVFNFEPTDGAPLPTGGDDAS